MNELTPYSGGLARRESRRVSRELARMDGQGQLELARINQQADLQAERVSAVSYVGKRAMHEVAMVSQLEVQLSAPSLPLRRLAWRRFGPTTCGTRSCHC